jgi:threonine/homoserine/homoserine lactone efflux protein
MPDWVFIKGLAIGFLIAAPVGPVNVLCVRRTLAHGRLAGFVSGLGASLADTIFGAIAAFGVLIVMDWIIDHRFGLAIAGAALLFVLGLRALMRSPPPLVAGRDPTGLIADFTSTFLLTLANPITIFSFIGVYVAFGIRPDGRVDIGDWLLLGGVFSGATLWWLLLAGFSGAFRSRFNAEGMRIVNRVAGIVMIAFALLVLYEAFRDNLPVK